jgi:hypothetical protein
MASGVNAAGGLPYRQIVDHKINKWQFCDAIVAN